MKKLIYGVGINDLDGQTSIKINGKWTICPVYSRWYSMLRRCYSGDMSCYADCSVSKEWLVFSNFKKWIEDKDYQGKDIDKDIIKPGNKVYGPDTCCVVDKQINYLLINTKEAKGRLPLGVLKKDGKFSARMRVRMKNVYLGTYDTAQEAHFAYAKGKSKHIIRYADKQSDKRIRAGLLHASGIILLSAFIQGCVYRLPCMTCG